MHDRLLSRRIDALHQCFLVHFYGVPIYRRLSLTIIFTIAVGRRLSISTVRYNRHCQTSFNSDFNVKSLLTDV